ncbi:MAG: hypothetical protein P1U74_03140 [Legionellaceae bacterium]|nr:hypothetical protein [Legionellaceae bacterium]
MTINVSEQEKSAVHEYFSNPQQYIADNKWPVDRPLPDGTKLKRGDGRSFFVIPNEDRTSTYIDIIHPLEGDSSQYSATFGAGKIFFHSQKLFSLDGSLDLDTIPEALQHSWYEGPPEGEESAYDKEERRDENKDFLKLGRGVAVDYYLYRNNRGENIKKVVKPVIDIQGNRAVLKSVKSCDKAFIEQQGQQYKLAPHLYFFPPVIKESDFFCVSRERFFYKSVEIMYDAGDNLLMFLDKNKTLASAKKDQLICGILKAYIVQISSQNIIHTDIKPENICIRVSETDEVSFIITFIDFEGTHIYGDRQEALGTAVYLPPEMFKTYEDFVGRFELYKKGIKSIESALVDNYRYSFSKQSDIFSLGQTLSAFNIPETSRFHSLLNSMCAIEPSQRPDAETISELLGDNDELDVAKISADLF